jgi:predicted RNA-binding protein with PIN domain
VPAEKRIFIDAWNVIRTTPSLAQHERSKGNAAARARFLEQVARAFERESAASEWVVVFDGSSDGHGEWEKAGGALVRYCAPRSADDVIVEMAADAVAAGAETVIVSNDRAVEHPGARRMLTTDFEERLLSGAPIFAEAKVAPPPVRRGAPKVTALVEHLMRAGHLAPGAAGDAKLHEALRHALDYASVGAGAANKTAKRLEKQLRALTRVSPDPDPEKTLFRSLKAFFEKA